MKKVAILTQPLGFNYGGIVQNYALQQVLKKQGYEPETVARVSKTPTVIKLLSAIKNNTFNKVSGSHAKIFSGKEKAAIAKNMTRFIRERINISKELHCTNELKRHFEERNFEAVIVGSDQTWRPQYSANIGNYFLDFLQHKPDIKKMAYASSFGVDFWEFDQKTTEKSKNLIRLFHAVSVREKSGVELCRKHLDVEASWVLDPTLLLTDIDYVQLFDGIDYKKNGLFNYVLDREPAKQELITQVAENLGMPIYFNSPLRSMYGEKNFAKLDDYVFPPVEHWVKSFYDADFVITDSFHGTVFSLIFNKPFIAIVNEERGAARFKSLLDELGLADRLVTDVKSFDDSLLQKPIDYETMNKKLDKLRKTSLNFLKESLKS